MLLKTSTLKLITFSLLFTASTMVHSFSILGTAWDPGANTARFGGSPAAGGATWSIIGVGIGSDVFFDTHPGTSTSLAALNPSLNIATVIDNAFNLWADVSNFTNLGQVADSGVGFGASEAGATSFGDIRIGAVNFDGSGGILAHGYQPGTEDIFSNGSIAGDIHIDNSENWDPSTSHDGFDLATVLLHEIGHAIGLGHSNDPNSVMFASYQGIQLALGDDDVAGIQSIYGAAITDPAVVPLPGAPILFLSAMALIGFIKRQRASIHA